ncbi:MAG: PEP-CTERM sorting domain-containing protein [Acidobacteriota bacterium]|nr:PEP-CTERM sorting domain-containing protein [Acidobacteriota bacterium]
MRKIVLICAVLCISCSVALADTITFSGISPNGGNPVSAAAVVTTGNGTVTIVLNNLQGNFSNAGQLLSDFSVDLSDSSTATPTVTSNGNLINVGSFKDTPPGQVTSAGTGPSLWTPSFAAGIPSGESVSLNGLNGNFGLGPSHLVIGAACTGGNYCDADGSIAGNGPHNPMYQGTLTFTITGFTGITSSTTASNAVFSFGTTAGDDVPGSVVPEPASLLLFGTGLLGLGLIVRRKFARAA